MPNITTVFTDGVGGSFTITNVGVGTNGTIIANYSIPATFNFTQAIITFVFVNPTV